MRMRCRWRLPCAQRVAKCAPVFIQHAGDLLPAAALEVGDHDILVEVGLEAHRHGDGRSVWSSELHASELQQKDDLQQLTRL